MHIFDLNFSLTMNDYKGGVYLEYKNIKHYQAIGSYQVGYNLVGKHIHNIMKQT